MTRIRNSKAIALVLALISIVVLSLIAATILIYVYNQTSLNYKAIRRQKAYANCEAAMNYAYQYWAAKGTQPPDDAKFVIYDTSNPPKEVAPYVTLKVVTNGTIECSATY